MNDVYDMNRTLAEIAQDVVEESDPRTAISMLTRFVADSIDGADGAGVSLLVGRGGVETIGATSLDLEAADRFQHELGEGPCLSSLRDEHVIHVGDLAHDSRWPRWRDPVVSTLGYHSVLSAALFTRTREVGALNVYSRRVGAFTSDDVVRVPIFAAHAAVAITSARLVQQLHDGMVSRTCIGQAEGILMERHGLTSDVAFAVLARVSQHTNRKLVDVCHELVATGEMPDDPLA